MQQRHPPTHTPPMNLWKATELASTYSGKQDIGFFQHNLDIEGHLKFGSINESCRS